MSHAESVALALAADPAALRARLTQAASDLVPELKVRMRRPTFDPGARTLTGQGLRLHWQLRRRPDLPESYDNQQTSQGYIIVELLR